MRHSIDRSRPSFRPWPLLALGILALAGCGAHRAPEMGPSSEVRRILGRKYASPGYYEALTRLHRMGPEIDAVLVDLARNPAVNTTVRANALILLAERQSSAALPALSRALLTEEIPVIRSAAVLGLQRLGATNDSVATLIRGAVGDRSRSVRLNALQALDIREVETIRQLLAREQDREVRKVAMQLVALAESRGAPLEADRRGALRTTGPETDPQIVFRAARADAVAGWAVGDLRVELPNSPDLPLTPAAEVVGGVVPAFFSRDRSRVVFEAEREIRVVHLGNRTTRSLGPGIAPRPIPFTNEFLYLREIGGTRREMEGATEIRYDVLRAKFNDGEPELLGEMTAAARPDVHGNYSPVRWMVVAESAEGLVLRADGGTSFVVPAPVWRTGAPGSLQEDGRFQVRR